MAAGAGTARRRPFIAPLLRRTHLSLLQTATPPHGVQRRRFSCFLRDVAPVSQKRAAFAQRIMTTWGRAARRAAAALSRGGRRVDTPLGGGALAGPTTHSRLAAFASSASPPPQAVSLAKLADSFAGGTQVGYLDELEAKWRENPGSVDTSWAAFFKLLGALLPPVTQLAQRTAMLGCRTRAAASRTARSGLQCGDSAGAGGSLATRRQTCAPNRLSR